jgi:hypothetical protein
MDLDPLDLPPDRNELGRVGLGKERRTRVEHGGGEQQRQD